MNYKNLLASFSLALLSLSANAVETVTLTPALVHTQSIILDESNTVFSAAFVGGNAGKSFLEVLNFSLDGPSILGSSLTSKLSGGHDLDITSFGLYSGATLIAAGTRNSTGSIESWGLDAVTATAGLYSLRVGGVVVGNLGVAFSGDGYVSAVPEPESASMLIGGLAVLCFIARRRRSGDGMPAVRNEQGH
ncbi:FxDxF family PEP-CTERM protein [Massilia sp. DWR3-1-1]|uniref:FxDxF family PEP-CTERM protein n=1 Tax=Massilia sp. DWR3-1-1 TaxID=2804559 RepID=UPI003CF11CB1